MNKTGLHWHETHTEYLRVSSGKASVTIDGVTSIIDSNSSEICIRKEVVHGWGVIENDEEELIIWERIESGDGEKEIFFRSMVSSLVDSSMGNLYSPQADFRRLSFGEILQFFLPFRYLDNYPVVWNGFGKRYITYSLLKIVDLCGRLFFGLQAIYIEYTPEHFWEKNKENHTLNFLFLFNFQFHSLKI